MRLTLAHVVALASVAALGFAAGVAVPPSPMGEPAPSPAPMGEPAPMPAPSLWVLVVERPGEPGEYEAADYGLSLGDCVDAMNAAPREARAACERDRG